MPGAQNAIRTCLAILPGERVALIADAASAPVAASLEQALAERGARADCVLIESIASRPLRAAPAPVLEAREVAEAGILCVQPQEGELTARMAIVALVERRRIRYAHMVGVTPRIMREGLRADYRLVDRLSQQLCDRMRTAVRLNVKTRAGTDFVAGTPFSPASEAAVPGFTTTGFDAGCGTDSAGVTTAALSPESAGVTTAALAPESATACAVKAPPRSSAAPATAPRTRRGLRFMGFSR